MSVVSEDEEVVDLSLQLSSLRVSVSGPSSLAFEALRRVSEWFRGTRGGNPPSSNSSDHFTVVTTPRPSSGPSASRPTTTRASIEASFPEVPAGLLLSGRRLSGSELSGEERIRRAWRAGCWARAVLSGRVATPSASVQLNLRPRIYVVLRTPRLAAPACFSSSGSFFGAVGRGFREPDTISHSFPSETEARVYCQAADVAFPEIQP